jgi:hypothetical protein
MKHTSLLIAAAGIIMAACDNPEGPAGPEATTPQPSFVVFGTVRDEAGLAVSGAVAEIATGQFRGWSKVSNDSGYFSFAGVSGPATVRVWKDGYQLYVQKLVVTADLALEVGLVSVEMADGIQLGRTISSTVRPDAPPCDPAGWDAQAPCRRLPFTAPVSGVLAIRIWWFGGSPLDATIVAPDGAYLGMSVESGVEEIRVSATVRAGEAYEIRVNSYYDYQAFTLRADLLRADLPPATGKSW